MRIPLSIIGKLAAKAVVWIAPRLGKSPRELVADAAGEVVQEVERHHPSNPPLAPR